MNLFYDDTAEWDTYEAMRGRLENIHGHVGEYQPILYDPAAANQLSVIIRSNAGSQAIKEAISSIASEARLNLDTLNSSLEDATMATAEVTMSDLRRTLEESTLLPQGWSAEHVGGLHWKVQRADGIWYTVTTDRVSYEYAQGSVEWFGPGSPAFPA